MGSINMRIRSAKTRGTKNGCAKFKIKDTAIVAIINNEPVIILLVSNVCFI
jgi:hypothetical protein